MPVALGHDLSKLTFGRSAGIDMATWPCQAVHPLAKNATVMRMANALALAPRAVTLLCIDFL
jgi:hypothetical protein